VKSYKLPSHDTDHFARTGFAVVWCPNNRAPRPPKTEPIPKADLVRPLTNCHPHYQASVIVEGGERVLIDGVECVVREVQMSLSRDQSEARFEAWRVQV
jgi:hypothetical protein